jgi:heptosyltransferase-3
VLQPADRILVFRLGSIGDFVVALPCFNLIRRRYPEAEITLLTNKPSNELIVSAETVLKDTGLVDRYVKYSGGTRDYAELWQVRQEIRALAPDALIYLAPLRSLLSTYRDYLFFRLCGIQHIIGAPAVWGVVGPRPAYPHSDLVESEAVRLGWQLAELGDIDFNDRRNWDFRLSAAEIAEAASIFAESFGAGQHDGGRRVLGLSIGTKQAINNWGNENWHSVLQALGSLDYGLLLFGSAEDRQASQELAEGWPGTVLNLCGRTSPRVSAAMLKHVRLFLCHDSGPMHLAAAVGTPCVAIFSRRNPPGQWFPFGRGHQILYPTSRAGTIRSISPRQVVAAVIEALAEHGTTASPAACPSH